MWLFFLSFINEKRLGNGEESTRNRIKAFLTEGIPNKFIGYTDEGNWVNPIFREGVPDIHTERLSV